jgi:hypothetical protein
MHLCFATPWGTSWKPFAIFFHMIWTHVWLSLFHYSWSFICVSFHVITWLLSFFYQDYIFHAHVLTSFDPSAQRLHWWSRLCRCMSPQKIIYFVITYLLEDKHELSLGMLICLKRIYNFWCSMLVFTPFALCFITLCGVFMRFPELTYWQDVAVPVPCFLLFLCFRKATQEIFLELDETSSRTPIFPGRGPKTEREPEGGQGPASPWGGVAQPLAAPPVVRPPWSPPDDAPSPIKKPRDGKP